MRGGREATLNPIKIGRIRKAEMPTLVRKTPTTVIQSISPKAVITMGSLAMGKSLLAMIVDGMLRFLRASVLIF